MSMNAVWTPIRHSLAPVNTQALLTEVVKSVNAVLTWGKGERGSLGHGEDLSNQLLPKKVETWAQGQ